MMKVNEQNKAFYWSTIFLREIHACGVSHIVISPGSRSTPLTLAAASHPGLQTHVVLDERSAAFLALGLAKASDKPAALICTSGTAVANYYPAVVEARQSGVPLLLLTADRPPNLRNIGASQAINQIKIFSDYPVFFHESGEPKLEPDDLNRLRIAACQSFNNAITHHGPAHINFPFRKPLEPDSDFVNQIKKENQDILANSPQPKVKVYNSAPSSVLSNDIQSLLDQSERPVIISGPNTSKEAAGELARILSAPLLEEFPGSISKNNMRGFDGYLKNLTIRQNLAPDLIIRFGQQPVSKALHLYLQEYDHITHIHFGNLEEWQDATYSTTHRIEWDGGLIFWNIKRVPSRNNWLEKWHKTDREFLNFKAEQLDLERRLNDGHVFQQLGNQIPDSWNVFLSNSFPIRDWMLFSGSPPHPVFVNRGASGIDGLISTAIGATLESRQPGILFIGDLATLHDSNALLSGKLLESPLIIVLLNNGGGNIFRMLPIYQHQNLYTDFFETPQKIFFQSLAEAHGVKYHLIESLDQLYNIRLETLASSAGISLLECVTDSKVSMRLRNSLWNFPGQR